MALSETKRNLRMSALTIAVALISLKEGLEQFK